MAKSEGRIAKRYARALFGLLQTHELEKMLDGLNKLARAWEANPDLRAALANPSVAMSARTAVIQDVAKRAMDDVRLSNFCATLLRNNRLAALPAIASNFKSMLDAVKNLLALEIVSASEMPEDERGAIHGRIQQQFGSLATIEWYVDPDLIGGLVVKSGDKLLDASVKGALENLRTTLLA